MNNLKLKGKISREIKIGETKTTTPYAFFSLATGEKKQDGTWNNIYHQVKAFGKAAEWIKHNLRGGEIVEAEGMLKYEPKERENIKYREAYLLAFKVNIESPGTREYRPDLAEESNEMLF